LRHVRKFAALAAPRPRGAAHLGEAEARQANRASELIDEAIVKLASVEQLIAELEAMEVGDSPRS
jgi:hypothetical protein